MGAGIKRIWLKTLCAVTMAAAVLPLAARGEGFDTEHIFGFMIGTDVGTVGEREFQSQTTGRFARSGGTYRAVGQELEAEFVPMRDFRVELGTTFMAHDINRVPGFDDRRQLSWQGVSVDLRYRLLDREAAPFGVTLALETHADRVDETSAAVVRSHGTELTLAFDREVIPDFVLAAVNLSYEPEWTRLPRTGAAEQEATLGMAFGLMAKVRPDILIGGEARYFRKYEGIGLDELAGQALFIGPTAYFQLSEKSRLTATWGVQAWGQRAGGSGNLDLVNFERHQARLVFGVNF
ncbi:hypothetical protein CI1B_64450 [Bradyrhizobium ivorense]|uniref:Outer membrane protein beta-barrel domain-containing protein n=1 Tax=Bradyrhizobium ivorense TaxID=2511166 RepID=A0A508TQ14_9BRAD|nr:hypothetical protein [Bradyrhizobium ivorense]VIO76440.1 hypothetical protein CI1B_64450 [Bradyrhizobium ivorense]